MFMSKVLWLFCLFPFAPGEIMNKYVRFVKDFVGTPGSPKIVTTLVCWEYEYLFALRHALPFTYVRTPFLNQNWHNKETSVAVHQHELFIMDTSCPQATDFLMIAEDNQLFSFPFSWLLLSNGTYDNTVKSLKSFGILPDSNVVIAENKDNYLFLYQVFKTAMAHDLIYEPYGNWTEDHGIADIRSTKINSRRRRDLLGTNLTLSLVITNNNSVNHLDDYEDKHIDTITKLSYKLSNHLLDTINATKHYTKVPSWGYKDPKVVGSWNGMLGELLRGEADLGTPLFLTTDRVPIIEYISMTTPTQARFVFRTPPLSYVTNLYVLPFGRGVWIACGGLILSMVTALSITSQWEHENETGILIAVSDSLLMSLGAVCQQGPPRAPSNPAGRIVSLFLFISVMFLYTSYTANIVSLLQARTYSIKTLKDLLHSPLKFGVDDTVYNHYYFSTATEPVRKAIYEKKVAPKGKKAKFMNITEGVKNMRKGLFAFHMERGAGYKLVSETFYEDEKCGLIEVDFLTFNDPWMPVRKQSPYKEIFKVNMFKIRESGIQAREVSHHYTKKPSCTTGGASFVSVGLSDCYSGAFVLSVGSALSLTILTFEKLFRRRDEIQKQESQDTETSSAVDEHMEHLEYIE